MLAAQGYQESRLDQRREEPRRRDRHHAGDARDGKGAEGRRHPQADANVHAGSKYMAQLMERYFKDAKFDRPESHPVRLRQLQRGSGQHREGAQAAAAQEGLNPDVWFNQVEHVVARRIGQEPVRYVRNIFKYYVAYKLAQQTEAVRSQHIERLKGAGGADTRPAP